MTGRLPRPSPVLPWMVSLASYRVKAAAVAAAAGRRLTPSDRRLVAYVSCSVWFADCPHCAGGIAIEPEWPFAACLGCGHTFAQITVPPQWRAIEALLAVRPAKHQHWQTWETEGDLRRDNASLGIGG